jgi:hypothetical protein
MGQVSIPPGTGAEKNAREEGQEVPAGRPDWGGYIQLETEPKLNARGNFKE